MVEISGKTADVTDVQVIEVVDCWFIEHGPEGDWLQLHNTKINFI